MNKGALGWFSIGLVGVLGFAGSGYAQSQLAPPKPFTHEELAQMGKVAKEHCGQAGQPGSLYQILCADTKPAAPAPKHDISGTWEGPIGAVINHDVPPMTALGAKLASMNHTNGATSVADSNDPLDTCDPLGFPRNTVWEIRGLEIGEMPNRVLILAQYERIWREVWTDGRAQPKDVGGDDPNAPDPRYYGYSVGHWDGDYTFVVDTIGADTSPWLDNAGHPQSKDLHVTERYERVDHNTLKVTVNVDDPTIFTKPFLLGTTVYKWIPNQEMEEQLCIPSEALAYRNAVAGPAAQKKE